MDLRNINRRRPLREVVSWNVLNAFLFLLYLVDLFVRSWVETQEVMKVGVLVGVDLFVRSWVETQLADGFKVQGYVDLFVRSRVETCLMIAPFSFLLSTSSWGRELKHIKYPLACLVTPSTSSWGRELKHTVADNADGVLKVSTSSWGRELKQRLMKLSPDIRRPLREVVSWNNLFYRTDDPDVESTSSWGRELKRQRSKPL